MQMMKGKLKADTLRESCGINVTKALEWPLVKLMLSSLKSQGCITDMFERHLSCDICKDSSEFPSWGGYDDKIIKYIYVQIILDLALAKF